MAARESWVWVAKYGGRAPGAAGLAGANDGNVDVLLSQERVPSIASLHLPPDRTLFLTFNQENQFYRGEVTTNTVAEFFDTCFAEPNIVEVVALESPEPHSPFVFPRHGWLILTEPRHINTVVDGHALPRRMRMPNQNGASIWIKAFIPRYLRVNNVY